MIDANTLRTTVAAWCAAMHACAPELNELDGRLGDADLGSTLDKCAALMEEAVPELPGQLDAVFRRLAQASAKASGSSFGTLLTVALMTAGKRCAGIASLDRAGLAALLSEIVGTLSARGGASLGDKTVLDALQAVAEALEAASDDADLRQQAGAAVQRALDEFRSRPNRIGRARMFADKTIGMDDPGMVALQRMVQAI